MKLKEIYELLEQTTDYLRRRSGCPPERRCEKQLIPTAWMATLLLVIVIIAVALAFDYINGFHDAANSVATIVATRVLSPGQAVMWAAFFNFVAAFGSALRSRRPW